MEDNKNLSSEQMEFIKALEESGNATSFRVGNIVKGKIVQFDETDIFVDFEYKVEGRVDRHEFYTEPVIGDEVEAIIKGTEKGYILLSKSALDRRKAQGVIEKAIKNNESVQGIVKENIKGGFNVTIMGYQAFCPLSQIDISRCADPNEHINKVYDFKVIKNKNLKDIVVSRRVLQEEAQNASIETFLNSLKEGDIIDGKVKNIEKFGTFVEITKGLDGFLAIPNMSWSKSINPKSILNRGDEKKFKVLSIDKEKKRVDLGLKQLEDDTWIKFVEEHKVGDIVKGEVTNIKKFGAFVKVYENVEGLLHISDLSWNSHVNNPNDFVKSGDYVECKILEINVEDRKLTLGLKQVQDNPWDVVEYDFPVKTIVKCKAVRMFKNFTVFELPNGLEGICDISDFDWKNNVVNMKDYVQEGKEFNMVIISIDRNKQRIKLSYKHTTESPWKLFERNHPEGSIVDGIVKNIIDSGAIISLENNMEGYMHISQIDIPKGETLDTVIKIGETYPFVVREVNQVKRRISLSRKEYQEVQNKKETQSYIAKEEPTSITYNPFEKI